MYVSSLFDFDLPKLSEHLARRSFIVEVTSVEVNVVFEHIVDEVVAVVVAFVVVYWPVVSISIQGIEKVWPI